MSANGSARAEFESANHLDGHGTNLGPAGHRSRDRHNIRRAKLEAVLRTRERTGNPAVSMLPFIPIAHDRRRA